jgi:ABC-2 type transport system permease protein
MANPILYMVNGFRYGILGVSDVNPYVSLGMILAFIVVLAVVALRMLARGKGIRH